MFDTYFINSGGYEREWDKISCIICQSIGYVIYWRVWGRVYKEDYSHPKRRKRNEESWCSEKVMKIVTLVILPWQRVRSRQIEMYNLRKYYDGSKWITDVIKIGRVQRVAEFWEWG